MKKNIVIIGGGNCGWTTALFLLRNLSCDEYKITLIASEKIGIIGVGESTVPYVKEFYNKLGLSDAILVQHASATYKLGINFTSWNREHSYLHPFFSTSDQSLLTKFYQGIPSYVIWNQYFRSLNFNLICDMYGLLFEKNLGPKKEGIKDLITYAYHVDSIALGTYLKDICTKEGINYQEGKVEGYATSLLDKSINFLSLDTGKKIPVDFCFDCTGFNSFFLQKQEGNDFVSYGDELLCDTALVCRTKSEEHIKNHTISDAMDFGWRWEIPLTKYRGNGYVFDKKLISSDEAKNELIKKIGHENIITDIREVPFKTGRFKQAWVKNCIGIGAAYAFIEPLESTGITTFCRQLDMFFEVFQSRGNKLEFTDKDIDEYNQSIAEEVDNIKDFIVLHYFLASSYHTDFWQKYEKKLFSSYSHSFQKKIEYIRNNYLTPQSNFHSGFIRPQSYLYIMVGSGSILKKLHGNIPRLSQKLFLNDVKNNIVDFKKLLKFFKSHKESIRESEGQEYV